MKKRIDTKTASRIEKITEEMYHPENFLFISSWFPVWCTLCDKYENIQRVFPSFEDLIFHLDCYHQPSHLEETLDVEEALIRAMFVLKQAREIGLGRFSN